MMDEANMIKPGVFGVPKDYNDSSKGLIWKKLLEMKDSDFESIEAYFLSKKK